MENMLLYQNLKDCISDVAKWNRKKHVDQGNLIIEECSELIKEVAKCRRGMGDFEHLLEECYDVLTTISVLFYLNDIPEERVLCGMSGKCVRTLTRYEETGQA